MKYEININLYGQEPCLTSAKSTLRLLWNEFRLTNREVEIISHGNNGCFLFFIDVFNVLQKLKVSNLGINYINEDKFIELINNLPIKNKQRRNYDSTYTSINNETSSS